MDWVWGGAGLGNCYRVVMRLYAVCWSSAVYCLVLVNACSVNVTLCNIIWCEQHKAFFFFTLTISISIIFFFFHFLNKSAGSTEEKYCSVWYYIISEFYYMHLFIIITACSWYSCCLEVMLLFCIYPSDKYIFLSGKVKGVNPIRASLVRALFYLPL